MPSLAHLFIFSLWVFIRKQFLSFFVNSWLLIDLIFLHLHFRNIKLLFNSMKVQQLFKSYRRRLGARFNFLLAFMIIKDLIEKVWAIVSINLIELWIEEEYRIILVVLLIKEIPSTHEFQKNQKINYWRSKSLFPFELITSIIG